MRTLITVATLTLMCGSAVAQTGSPANGNDMNKPGTMEKGTMNNGMNSGSGMNNTTGMSQDDKGNPKKEMSKDGSPSAGSKDMTKK